MDFLKDLIRIQSKSKLKQIEVIGNENDEIDSKFNQLYQLIQKNPTISEDEAIATLYGHGKRGKSAFRRLKNRLEGRLLNTLFFIDINQSHFSDIDKAFYTCNKNWLAVRTLINFEARSSAIKLAEHTLKYALKYEFSELVVFISKELVFHYSLVHADPKRYKKYKLILNKYNTFFQAEFLAESFYTELMKEFGTSQQKVSDATLKRAKKYVDTLREKHPNVTTYRFIRIGSLLKIVTHQISNEYNEAIYECLRAKDILQKKPYDAFKAIFAFDLRLLSCYIQLKEFKQGNIIADHYVKNMPSGSYDWYVVLFYGFLLNCHCQNYERANNLLEIALSHSNFDKLFPSLKELWLLNQGFIEFLKKVEIVSDTDNSLSTKRKFRLYKFLNDIPIYSKDKRGINISLLILHVLFLLSDHKYSEIIDRVDALNQYCHRYLKRDDTFRANCFIKMLLQMARADFNRIRTERYASKYWHALLTMPLDVASQGVEVEIIPYEDLWQLALELLD